MKLNKLISRIFISCFALFMISCSGDSAKKAGDSDGEEGEEKNMNLALTDQYNQVRHGARLILNYDKESNSFVGTVENTTQNTLSKVRVEVHLSNGKEIGPSIPVDLEAGEKIDVKLAATSTDFNKWTAHPEVGGAEHGHSHGEHDSEHSEHGHEHGSEHSHEHDGHGHE